MSKPFTSRPQASIYKKGVFPLAEPRLRPDAETRLGATVGCRECQKPFTPTRPWMDFCSTACRLRFHNARRGKPPDIERPLTAPQQSSGPEEGKAKTKRAKPNRIESRSKLATVARALYDGRALDCFMAVRELHDFTLRSTISTLANEYGVEIARRNKSVPGHLDSTVTCVEYTITDAGRVRLGELLDGQP